MTGLMKSILIVACGSLFWLAPAVRAEPDHSVAQSVVQIRGVDPQGRMYFGSGVVIGTGTVVTNCHVVRGGGRVGVFRGGEGYAVNGERVDVHRDLCILDVPGLGGPQAGLARLSQLKTGQPLAFYGYPRALGMSFSEGTLRQLHPFGGSRVLETSAFFTLGGSGGGLFDRRGRLVGLATFLAPGHSGRYYAIPADWIAMVKKHAPTAIMPLQGRSFWEEPTRLPDFLKRPGP